MENSNQSKSVFKYNIITGNFICEYESLTKAATSVNGDRSAIRNSTKFFKRSAYGYLWAFEKRENYTDLSIVTTYALSKGIDPSSIVKSKVYETKDGKDLVSIEIKPKPDISEEALKFDFIQKKEKQLQRKKDENRIINKNFREYARIENALTALNEKLIELLTSDSFKPITYQHPENTESPAVIVQLTDLHFNELVELPDNKYGFVVGAKRLQKYAHKIKNILDLYNSSKVILVITGDLLNSDRRLDEKLNMATNRAKASLLASRILYHFIQDINTMANIDIVSVSGNESRINEEWGMSDLAMTDNYDFLIVNMLKLLFSLSKGINFLDGDPVEQVINVNHSNILVTHGTTIKEGQAAMQQIFGKYSAKGILLDYAIFGHIHFTNITDIYSRSGSLVGNNIYSDRALNLVTKASQVVHVIHKDGDIDSLKIGLQYVDEYKGYNIKDDLEAYNSKLADNTRQTTTIVKVII